MLRGSYQLWEEHVTNTHDKSNPCNEILFSPPDSSFFQKEPACFQGVARIEESPLTTRDGRPIRGDKFSHNFAIALEKQNKYIYTT